MPTFDLLMKDAAITYATIVMIALLYAAALRLPCGFYYYALLRYATFTPAPTLRHTALLLLRYACLIADTFAFRFSARHDFAATLSP